VSGIEVLIFEMCHLRWLIARNFFIFVFKNNATCKNELKFRFFVKIILFQIQLQFNNSIQQLAILTASFIGILTNLNNLLFN